jgi:hypothetical protein
MRRKIAGFFLALALARCPAPPAVEPRPYVDDAGPVGSAESGHVAPARDAAPLSLPDVATPPVADAAPPDAFAPSADCKAKALGQSYGAASCHFDADCELVTLECCPPCGPMRPDSVRAVALGTLAPPCSLACPACVALPPPGIGVACVAGRCQVVEDPCAPSKSLLPVH